MPTKHVTTSQAPKPIGPYSQGVISGGFLFCSGQIALDPETGEMIEGGVEAQTERVLEQPDGGPARGQDGPRQRRQDDRLPRRHGRLPAR